MKNLKSYIKRLETMLLFQTYQVCWLSNHRCQGIQFQATALDYCTKYLLKDDMDNLRVQLNLIFCLYLGLLSAFSEEK